MKFNEQLEQLLKTLDKFTDRKGNLLKQNIKDSSEKFDTDLIKLLLSDKDTKAHFFDEIDDATIFNYRKFIDYIDDKNFLIDSYTKFSNKVGLTVSNKHLQQINDVVLSFPFKDCVLEGGQSRDDEKRKEIFFNEVLAKDEINRLLDKKVITNATRFSAPLRGEKYTKDGVSDDVKFNRDENGLIKDNLIIKGNNLLALHTLKSNFAGKVKLIYIDPPYNTGNDSFDYNDNFNHSTWLTFMKNRLEVARELLSDDGVIFVQCDDNEQAYLKVLMDEVFGRDNFISNIVYRRRKSQANLSKNISPIHDYITCYSKSTSARLNKIYPEIDESNFKNPDNDSRGSYVTMPCTNSGGAKYSITTPTGKIIKEEWKFKIETYKNLERDNRLVFPNKGNGKPRYKLFFVEKKEKGVVPNSWWDGLSSNQEATIELKLLFSKDIFSHPKAEKLLERIIELSTQKGDLVLDYHLGSGTTCSVAHKMGRQYIGIEQMDYIEDITVKRMQKVIEGEQGGISKSVDWQGGGEFIYFELDKYNQVYIDNLNAIKRGHASTKTTEQLYDEIVEHAFLNYDVESKKLLENKKDFAKLSLNEQQEFLISILNKNQLYKNLSEMDDKELLVDEKTKALNRDFYNE
jgi:adenine-specific DNA-methyltransferase